MAKSEQVIRLEGDEDIHAVRTIIARAQTERLLLDVPRGHSAFRSVVRLKLLARQAHANGVQLALVARDPEIREQAREIALPVFRSVGRAQKASNWKQPSEETLTPRRDRQDNGDEIRRSYDGGLSDAPLAWQRGRESVLARREQLGAPANWADRFALIGLAVGILIVVSIGAVLVVPSARITLIPAQQEITTEFEAVADIDADIVALSENTLPAQRHSVTVEGRAQTATSGRKAVPDQPATGEVVFVNLLPQEVPIPQGTIVSTSAAVPVRFRTTEQITIPADDRATAPIEALNAGPSGNVDALLINRVEGPASTAVRVFNPDATQGGSVKQAQTVTTADKDQLREQLSQRLVQEGRTVIEDRVPEGFLLIPGTVEFEPVTESFDKLVGEQADVLSLLYRLRVSGRIVVEEDLQRIGRRTLRQRVASDQTLLEEGQRTEILAGEAVNEEETRVTAQARGIVAAEIAGGRVQDLVRGQPVDEAQIALLERLPLAATPAIEVTPSWWPRMPYLPLRIFVRVAALSPADTAAQPEPQ